MYIVCFFFLLNFLFSLDSLITIELVNNLNLICKRWYPQGYLFNFQRSLKDKILIIVTSYGIGIGVVTIVKRIKYEYKKKKKRLDNQIFKKSVQD